MRRAAATCSGTDIALANVAKTPRLPVPMARIAPAFADPQANTDRKETIVTSFDLSAMATVLAKELPRHRELQAASAPDTLPMDPLASQTPTQAHEVVSFWTDAGPAMWFAKDPAFDRAFHDRFIRLHEVAAQGGLANWAASPQGALALLLLLDQFPRNAFRGMSRMYATDQMARSVADAAIASGHDKAVEPDLALFFYLPFAHSENLDDQHRSVALTRRLAPPNPAHAARHRDIIHVFGRFPHRNAILGRTTTSAEANYLSSGGYSG